MGEIDTKPIEPVQVARVLFGEKDHQKKKHTSSSSSDQENEKEREYDDLLKDLANYKLQLEAKDSAYLQAMLKLEHIVDTTHELSTLLKNTETERDFYIQEYNVASLRIGELNKISEAELLKDTEINKKVLRLEEEIAAVIQSNIEEKEKVQELVTHIAELNEAIYVSKMAEIENEKDHCTLLADKDVEVVEMRKQLEKMNELEDQLLAKSELVDLLQVQLNQAFESLSSLQQLKSEKTETKEGNDDADTDQGLYVKILEMELNQLKEEVSSSKSDHKLLDEELISTKSEISYLKSELDIAKANVAQNSSNHLEPFIFIEDLKSEKTETKEGKDSNQGVSIEILEMELQQLREEVNCSKSDLKLLDEELMSAKSEIAYLKSELAIAKTNASENFSNNHQLSLVEDLKPDAEEKTDENITISVTEYLALIQNVKDSDHLAESDQKSELETLKKELEVATVKVGEFRTRAEQAVSRAEAAEKAKLMLEDQLRKWRKQKQRQKAALAALREECVPKVFSPPPKHDDDNNTRKIMYQPLSKVLKMKF